jgi:glycine/D-amino acid oxidase-like deaminating enzyme
LSARTAEVVVCGAGIAGVAAAYHLAVRGGVAGVVLVDERPPLSLTSDKSTECYRNWWPGPGDAMVTLMNRSIDLLEEVARETDNRIRLNRRGYLFATADPARVPALQRAAAETSALGAGPLRHHAGAASAYHPAPADGFEGEPTGADLITDAALIRRHFPYLAADTVAVLHARRGGWFSGQQLGAFLLERARDKGARVIEGRVERIVTGGSRVSAVDVATPSGTTTLATPALVNAAGPFVADVGRLLGVELPVFCERHGKIAFADPLGAVPRDAPLLIWLDPMRLAWSEEERAALAGSPAHRHLLDERSAGVHGRPEGPADSPMVLALWTDDEQRVSPTFPLAFDPAYPEIVLRGMARMIPALGTYLHRLPRCAVDGGYYTKTAENRLLAGPLPVDGAYVLGALSGFGLMAASAAAELVAAHITGTPLPAYAPAFRLDRYDDPGYRAQLAHWRETGQL